MNAPKPQQAFPRPATYTDASGYAGEGWEGMSMLEYYAAQALPALLAYHRFGTPAADIAASAFELAEAMVAESAERLKP